MDEKKKEKKSEERQRQQESGQAGGSITEFISGLAKIGQEKQGIRYITPEALANPNRLAAH